MSFITFNGENINVSKILCVGANYPAHIAEMNPGKPPELPKEPVIFMKPPSAIIHNGDMVRLPSGYGEVHHEVELIAVIGKGGKRIAASEAHAHVLGYGVGLDLTLRDVQAEAKKKGRPWTIAKGFDTSAVLSDIVSPDVTGDPHALDLHLWINGQLRQTGQTSGVVFRIPAIIQYVSGFFTLNRGDVIFTGTPPGVGPLRPGDQLKAELGSIVELNVAVMSDD